MTHNNSDDLLTVILGWISSVIGQIALFGVELLRAAVIGAAGVIGGLIVKHYYYKWFKANNEKK